MAKIPVQVLADATASNWLSLSASDGADGLSLSLEHNVPIDVQLTRLVHERRALRNSFGISSSGDGNGDSGVAAAAAMLAGAQDAAAALPPPSTLGVIAFSRTPYSTEVLRKLHYKSPLPRPRSLGLDSLLFLSELLLPGVDRSASTSGSSEELAAYLNASGLEPSPWQIIHAGCTPDDFVAVSGYDGNSGNSNNNLSFGAASPAAAAAAAAAVAAAAAEAGEKKADEQQQPPTSARGSAPPPTPGRVTFILVGDLLSYCHQGIFSMVAAMARPFRAAAPRVVDHSLLAYCAQQSVIVAGGLRVSRDGCSVWRPRAGDSSTRRHASMIHKSSNLAIEQALTAPRFEEGCAVFVNHALGPAAHIASALHDDATLASATAFRRVLRITWTDAFHGAEHGGPEGRRRFSAPCVAVGVLHASQALQALRQAEHSHVFGRMRDSVMWAMSPDAALFPGPHLTAVRGPSFQVQPHLYVPNPLLSTSAFRSASPSAGSNNSSGAGGAIAASVSGSRSRSEFAAALSAQRQATAAAPVAHNPTVISTTVTILCDPAMQAVTILNNGRRVASWDISQIWSVKQRELQEQQYTNARSKGTAAAAVHDDADGGVGAIDLASVFYPVVDIGSAGTIVEIIC